MNYNSSDSEQLKILVIDDHHLIRGGTVEILKQHDPQADILTEETTQGALSSIEINQPHLVIVDLSLPEKKGMTADIDTGIALLKTLMEKYPTLNIMVQSSYIKALIRLKHNIDNHQGGFTMADKSLSVKEMLTHLQWCIQGITHTKELKLDLEIKPEWLEVLQLAFEEGLQDKVIAQRMHKSERMIRHYWTKMQDVLEIYPEEGKNMRALTQIAARDAGLID